MIRNPNRIEVPTDARSYITPHARDVCFKEIYEGYAKRFNIKLLYAYLNHDEDLMVDYCIIYKARNDLDTADLIIYDCPPIYSDRCTPSYLYYRNLKKRKKFFQFGIDEMVIMEKSKFFEYLVLKLRMSKQKNDPMFWKLPRNGRKLVKGLLDLQMQYVKKDPVGEDRLEKLLS